MPNQPQVTPEIMATIDGETVARSTILAWEKSRARRVIRKLKMNAVADDLTAQRSAIAQRKLQLGHDQIASLLRTQLRVSTLGAGVLTRLSGARRQFSSIELSVESGSVDAFDRWWHQHVVLSDEAPLLAICPDHWIIRTGPNNWQEIVEATGGSSLASRLFVDHHDIESLQSKPDPTYDHQITAVTRRRNGIPIGGLRHQLRSTATGFHMLLTAEFPFFTPAKLVAGHRWHLACEFSNIVEFSLSSAAQP